MASDLIEINNYRKKITYLRLVWVFLNCRLINNIYRLSIIDKLLQIYACVPTVLFSHWYVHIFDRLQKEEVTQVNRIYVFYVCSRINSSHMNKNCKIKTFLLLLSYVSLQVYERSIPEKHPCFRILLHFHTFFLGYILNGNMFIKYRR